MASSADKLCFDSYDLLARDADVLALAQAQWFSAKDIDPWDPATAREKCAQAFNDCANNHFDNGNYADALSNYTSALGILPDYSWAFCNRAAVHLATGDIEAALADYSEAIKIDPNDSALFNGRAFAALRTASSDGCDRQTLEGALKDVNQALALDENNGAAYCTKGEILKQMALAASSGDTAGAAAGGSETTVERKRLIDEAIVAQRCAIRLEPEAQEPRDYLRELLAMAGIDEEVADADEQADWASSTRSIPAPKPEASGAAAAAAAPAAADGGCEVQYPEGWLHKKGGLKDGERNWIKGGKRNWKVRWVSFDGVLIRWYDGKGGKELGSVELGPFDRVEVDADDGNKFCVRTAERDLWLKADDSTSATEWVSSIVAKLP